MTGKHKNQVGQEGTRNGNGGEWAKKTQSEPAEGMLTGADHRTGGDFLHVEHSLPQTTYAEMPHAQRKQSSAVASRVIAAQDIFRKPTKTYEPTPIENGNTAVYINIAYGDAPFDEVLNRVELTPDGELVRHDIAYMQGGNWRHIETDDDLHRFVDEERIPVPRTTRT